MAFPIDKTTQQQWCLHILPKPHSGATEESRSLIQNSSEGRRNGPGTAQTNRQFTCILRTGTESFSTSIDEPRFHPLSVLFFSIQYFIEKAVCLGILLIDERNDSAVAQYGDEFVHQMGFNH